MSGGRQQCHRDAEVIGDAGILCDPDSPDKFADGVRSVYHDRVRRQELIERGLSRIHQFRWTESAEKMAKLLESGAHYRERAD